MSERKFPVPPALIAAIVLFAIFAVALWILVNPTGVNTVTLPFELPGIGSETNEITILAALTAPVVGAIFVTGVILRVLFGALDGTVSNVKEDDAYKQAVAAASKRDKAIVKEYVKSQPPTPMPSHERPGWSVISTAMCAGLMMAFFGAAFSGNFLDEANQGTFAAGFAIVTMIAVFFGLNTTRVQKSEAEEGNPLPGGALWVVLTGFIVIGLGFGVMMWVRSQTG